MSNVWNVYRKYNKEKIRNGTCKWSINCTFSLLIMSPSHVRRNACFENFKNKTKKLNLNLHGKKWFSNHTCCCSNLCGLQDASAMHASTVPLHEDWLHTSSNVTYKMPQQCMVLQFHCTKIGYTLSQRWPTRCLSDAWFYSSTARRMATNYIKSDLQIYLIVIKVQ